MMTAGVRVGCAAILAFLAGAATAAAPAPETCEQLRARIGQPPLADPDLLRTLAARTECKFTAREFYRAAYGDRPLPPPESREHRHRHHGADDDD